MVFLSFLFMLCFLQNLVHSQHFHILPTNIFPSYINLKIWDIAFPKRKTLC